MEMTGITSRCNICGEFFDSRIELRKHKDKNHRITNAKRIAVVAKELTTTIPLSKGRLLQ